MLKAREKRLNKYFELNLKTLAAIISSWIISVILHNLVYAIFGIEEALFFIIAIFVIPTYFIISLIYTLVKKIKS